MLGPVRRWKGKTLAELKQVLADILAVPAEGLSDTVALTDIGSWNSLMHIELVVKLEETYKLDLTQDDIVEMISVGAIRDVLQRRGAVPA
jgi:acyl carrier protein